LTLRRIRKQDERKKRNKKRDAKESFIGLKRKGRRSTYFASTWKKALYCLLGEEEKTASRFEVSSEMPDDDRQLFADFVTDPTGDSVVASRC
jgi:hypothetical protein